MTSVAYVSYDRFPSAKGAAVHIRAFAEALAGEFGAVDLVTVPPSPEAAPGRLPAAVRHHPLPASGANLIERVICFRAQLRAWWQGRIFDVAHVRSIFEGFPLACRKQQYCRRLVVEVNGLPSIEMKYHYPEVADDADLLRKLVGQEQRLLEAADLVLTVSHVNKAHLISRGVPAARICVIPNGVDTQLFRFQRPRRWPASAELRLLYNGTLAAWQGVMQALEAVALYRRDFPAQLVLAGEGRARQQKEVEQRCYELGIRHAVRLAGPVTQPELADLHHQSDVALAPLRHNDRNHKQGCCPLKILDAMSSGTPLVASDLEVVRCLAQDGQQALLVRPGSGKAIKDALLRLRHDPHLAPQLSAAARRRVKTHFTWQHAQQRLREAYRRLLRG